LLFEPFANPFRVYELYKDVESFIKVLETGADCYTFNSAGYWKSSDDDLDDVKLQTSLTLQTGILMEQLEWEEWDLLPGAMIPTKESVEKILPGYYERYHPDNRENKDEYVALLKDRFKQRREYLKSSDVSTKPELLEKLVNALQIRG